MLASGTIQQIVVLGGKSSIAVLLLAAGGAKLADLRAFAATVRLFLPARAPGRLGLVVAGGIAAGELGAGAVSLSVPQAGWVNPVVFAICCGFLAVLVTGFFRHRGRPCHCFGALSQRGFTGAGIARAAALAVCGFAALARVPALSVHVSLGWQLALLAGAALIASAAFSAAAAAAAGSRQPGAAPPRWA